MKLDIANEAENGGGRKAFRTWVPGLAARVSGTDVSCEVKDLSCTGLALHDADGLLSEGQELVIDLLLAGKPFVTGATVRVLRRLPGGAAGCDFAGLDKKAEARLDKLVLEVQKRLIALKRSKEREG